MIVDPVNALPLLPPEGAEGQRQQQQEPLPPGSPGASTAIDARVFRRRWEFVPIRLWGPASPARDNDGKRPRVLWGVLQTDQCQTVLDTDPRYTVRAEDNLALLTGLPGRLFVVDVDKKDGGLDYYRREWEGDADRQASLASTAWMANTPSGGLHLYFRYTMEQHETLKQVLNSSKALSEEKEGQRRPVGIDVRTNGGYIVAPPSRRPDGGRYEWCPGRGPADIPLGVPPGWLVELLSPHQGRFRLQQQQRARPSATANRGSNRPQPNGPFVPFSRVSLQQQQRNGGTSSLVFASVLRKQSDLVEAGSSCSQGGSSVSSYSPAWVANMLREQNETLNPFGIDRSVLPWYPSEHWDRLGPLLNDFRVKFTWVLLKQLGEERTRIHSLWKDVGLALAHQGRKDDLGDSYRELYRFFSMRAPDCFPRGGDAQFDKMWTVLVAHDRERDPGSRLVQLSSIDRWAQDDNPEGYMTWVAPLLPTDPYCELTWGDVDVVCRKLERCPVSRQLTLKTLTEVLRRTVVFLRTPSRVLTRERAADGTVYFRPHDFRRFTTQEPDTEIPYVMSEEERREQAAKKRRGGRAKRSRATGSDSESESAARDRFRPRRFTACSRRSSTLRTYGMAVSGSCVVKRRKSCERK